MQHASTSCVTRRWQWRALYMDFVRWAYIYASCYIIVVAIGACIDVTVFVIRAVYQVCVSRAYREPKSAGFSPIRPSMNALRGEVNTCSRMLSLTRALPGAEQSCDHRRTSCSTSSSHACRTTRDKYSGHRRIVIPGYRPSLLGKSTRCN